MTLFYFTTTGNSLALARTFSPSPRSIVAELRSDGAGEGFVYRDPEAIGVVCPVYFGDLPLPVREWLASSRFETPYTFLLLTCGNTPGLAVGKALEIMPFDYADCLVTVDNYFPMYDVAVQVHDLPRKHVGEQTEALRADILARRRGHRRPGLYDRLAALYMRLRPLSPVAYRNFYILDDRCTRCGLCARICPAGNISHGRDGLPEIGSACMTCGACRHACPASAIRYRGEKSTYQYRHPDVTLRDLLP